MIKKEDLISTQLKVEDLLGDVISKNSFSPEQITRRNNFSAKLMWNLILV